MGIQTKSAFINFQEQVVVVTKSLIDGYLNVTHHGTGVAVADVKSVEQLEKLRADAEKAQSDYFSSTNGVKFIDMQRKMEVDTYRDFEEAGDMGAFDASCFVEAQAFWDAVVPK